jgi:hypothetical protein
MLVSPRRVCVQQRLQYPKGEVERKPRRHSSRRVDLGESLRVRRAGRRPELAGHVERNGSRLSDTMLVQVVRAVLIGPVVQTDYWFRGRWAFQPSSAWSLFIVDHELFRVITSRRTFIEGTPCPVSLRGCHKPRCWGLLRGLRVGCSGAAAGAASAGMAVLRSAAGGRHRSGAMKTASGSPAVFRPTARKGEQSRVWSGSRRVGGGSRRHGASEWKAERIGERYLRGVKGQSPLAAAGNYQIRSGSEPAVNGRPTPGHSGV